MPLLSLSMDLLYGLSWGSGTLERKGIESCANIKHMCNLDSAAGKTGKHSGPPTEGPPERQPNQCFESYTRMKGLSMRMCGDVDGGNVPEGI